MKSQLTISLSVEDVVDNKNWTIEEYTQIKQILEARLARHLEEEITSLNKLREKRKEQKNNYLHAHHSLKEL